MTSRHHFTRDNAPTKAGGDLWNDAQVCRRVFAHPDVERFSITSRPSGLYCSVRATLADGSAATMQVYSERKVAEVV